MAASAPGDAPVNTRLLRRLQHSQQGAPRQQVAKARGKQARAATVDNAAQQLMVATTLVTALVTAVPPAVFQPAPRSRSSSPDAKRRRVQAEPAPGAPAPEGTPPGADEPTITFKVYDYVSREETGRDAKRLAFIPVW